MAMGKRIILFLATNFLVIVTISIVTSLLGLNGYLSAYGIDHAQLLVFCTIWGMGGAFISLLMSRAMAKWSLGVQLIQPSTTNPIERQLLEIVYALARKAKLPAMPEVGIYNSDDINAFATGPSKSRSLVAVSTGLLQRMRMNEIEGVLGHEIAHVANGDMVTMTLLQGVINAFVMFFARAIAYAVTFGRDNEQRGGSYIVYMLVQIVLEVVFMILGSIVVAWFSRWREYRADAGGANLAGTPNMVNALEALRRYTQERENEPVPAGLKTLMISDRRPKLMTLFASHPPLEERIARLSGRQTGSLANAR